MGLKQKGQEWWLVILQRSKYNDTVTFVSVEQYMSSSEAFVLALQSNVSDAQQTCTRHCQVCCRAFEEEHLTTHLSLVAEWRSRDVLLALISSGSPYTATLLRSRTLTVWFQPH